MAAKAAFVVFVLSLFLVESVQSTLVGAQAPAPSATEQWSRAAQGAAQTVSSSAAEAAKGAKEKSSSWGKWFSNQLENMGLYNSDAPAPAPQGAF